jgi:hypothetical protein
MSTALDKVRLCMEAAEGTELDLSLLRELADKHRDQLEDVCAPEALDLIEPAKQWAVLVNEGLVPTGDFLDKRSREYVRDVAEAAYDEIDSRRPRSYWLAKEDEARDEEITRRLGLDAVRDEPVYPDTGSYDDE